MSYPKRLIEVDLPIKQISAHARREKSIRHGHISTLHIWWARRPLAACRAVICAALWPDPADEICPQPFRDVAAKALVDFAEKVRTTTELGSGLCADHWTRWNRTTAVTFARRDIGAWLDMRYALLDFIADFANWGASTVPAFLDTARALTHAAHEALGGATGTRPLVVDPFAGGGAIPLEALRVGADAFASDLNPVAVLLNKVVLEYIPKYDQRLADEVRKWGQWVKDQAEKELAQFYPKDPDGATPIAYLWARTIKCEGPGCGAEVPLIRSLWLSNKGSHGVALRIIPKPSNRCVDFDIVENARAKDVGEGTVRRGSATCPCCGYTTPVTSVRQQLKTRHGGADDARLFCVVTTRSVQQGRFYRLPTELDLEAVRRARQELERRKVAYTGLMSLVPNEPTPLGGGSGAGRAFSQRNYGMDRFEDLFTSRQALALTTLVRLVRQLQDELVKGDGSDFAASVQTVLGIGVSKLTDISNALCSWEPSMNRAVHIFARQAIPIIWDYAETSPIADAAGDYGVTIKNVIEVLEREAGKYGPGSAEQGDAIVHPLPSDAAQALITDPPYYDAVPYSDLSDFFYVWQKRVLNLPAMSELTPKSAECIVDEVKGKDREYFEATMGQAMAEGRRILSPFGIGVVVFAHKTTSGWEALLQAMIDAGWTVTGSWPIDTEWEIRVRAINSAALASSIHLVCRPREKADGPLVESVGDWRDVLAELPARIHDWMPKLANEGVVGADAIFACLGPALEIFSRYSCVEKASGEQVMLKEYLEHVWAAVAKEALNMIFAGADATGFEEDARLTAMWLWTLFAGMGNGKSSGDGRDAQEEDGETDDEESAAKPGKLGGYVLEYDAARKIAQGLGAHLEKLTSLVEVKGDKARLLPVGERAKALFGKEAGRVPLRRKASERQLTFLDVIEEHEQEEGTWGDLTGPPAGATVLDRVHQSMLLFAAGRGEALRRFLVEEGVGQDARFWRLAQALSALYPAGSDEKRWVDGVLARKKGLGF